MFSMCRWLVVVVCLAAPGQGFASSPATQPTTRPAVRVAIYNDVGGKVAEDQSNVAKCLKDQPGFSYRFVSAQQIRDGVLKDVDVLIQPGGTGGGQAKALEESGRQKIKDFVGNGGGYVGICAGSYLASSHYTWSLHILNAKVVDTAHWARGTGDVQVKFSEKGQSTLGVKQPELTIEYRQGPLLAPDDKKDLPAYTPLGTFATEIAKKGAPSGVMVGTTAIAAAPYQKGRVIAISPHPERRPADYAGLIQRAVQWAAGKDTVMDGERVPPVPSPADAGREPSVSAQGNHCIYWA